MGQPLPTLFPWLWHMGPMVYQQPRPSTFLLDKSPAQLHGSESIFQNDKISSWLTDLCLGPPQTVLNTSLECLARYTATAMGRCSILNTTPTVSELRLATVESNGSNPPPAHLTHLKSSAPLQEPLWLMQVALPPLSARLALLPFPTSAWTATGRFPSPMESRPTSQPCVERSSALRTLLWLPPSSVSWTMRFIDLIW